LESTGYGKIFRGYETESYKHLYPTFASEFIHGFRDNAFRKSSEGTLEDGVEAGSNTSTVTLRVVEDDEIGSLKSETVKYGRKSQGTRTRERLRWQGPAAYTKDRPVLSSERPLHGNKNVTVRQK
jgi:hypothetical protein